MKKAAEVKADGKEKAGGDSSEPAGFSCGPGEPSAGKGQRKLLSAEEDGSTHCDRGVRFLEQLGGSEEAAGGQLSESDRLGGEYGDLVVSGERGRVITVSFTLMYMKTKFLQCPFVLYGQKSGGDVVKRPCL